MQPRCAGCRALSDGFKVCGTCRSWLSLKSVIVASNYEDISEQLVKSLKFDYQRQAVGSMTDMMVSQIPEDLDGYIICPIPTSSERVRQRGFDHALLLSKAVAKKLNCTHELYLRREGNTRQVGASRAERIAQMEKAFVLAVGIGEIKGKKILLVDDVMTTGATVSAAAKILKKAGASKVSALIFSQKS